jgi:hypothetical protein
MKKIYSYLIVSVMVLLTSCSSTQNFAQTDYYDSQDISYQQFYDGLSPYGNWIDYPNYGYVWMPNEQGFRPYYNNGHWLYTNYGWTWVSDYDWGWAPFHYGRWLYDYAYGWMWVPGYEWAPAWVSWRSGNGCYGWAPLGPGMNFDMNIGSRIPENYWAFVPNRYINSPRINNYYVSPEKNRTIINNSTVINNTIRNNNTVYVTGPSAIQVEKVTNEKIRPARIIQKSAPGGTRVSGSTVAIYKPAVRELPQQNQQVKPARIINLNDMKERRQESGTTQNQVPAKQNEVRQVLPDTRPQPVTNSQKAKNLPPAVSEKQPTVAEQQKSVSAQQKTETNPVIQKQIQVQQPQKVVPVQQAPQPPVKQENITREQKNERQIQQDNPVIKNNPAATQPPVNNQPPRVRGTDQPMRNLQPGRQDVAPAPSNNDQPVRNKQYNMERQQQMPANNRQYNTERTQQMPSGNRQYNMERPRQMPPGDRQIYRSPVNQSPAARSQNPQQSDGNRRDGFSKERR